MLLAILLLKDLIYLLGTLLSNLLLSKTSYFIASSITSLRIKYTKGLSLKEKVVESDEIERVGKGD
jgi:uncharacterized membrane protein YiaA